ncbi:DUF1294 domain-containing protein [Chryseobacterium piscicola]|jgi:uncharacterized membrane protein YsdA (DUF1294 family)|uniref:DUF1294 domain-containing protein n=1 Tax=Chryseobacterium piscicola TaxID=551459 RepID=A0A2S7KBK2_9FLAO|nr:DUF1294 domain-containing protein [Chryseobacterium piscicola]PQA90108.1 hypothetical protein B0A70_15165 [Chryseobacterium piscicola]
MFYFILLLNFITFSAYTIDKWYAIKHKKRISEAILLIFSFFGGTIGAVLSMIIFNHKIAKKSFLLKLSLVVLLQIFIAGIIYWLQSGRL